MKCHPQSVIHKVSSTKCHPRSVIGSKVINFSGWHGVDQLLAVSIRTASGTYPVVKSPIIAQARIAVGSSMKSVTVTKCL